MTASHGGTGIRNAAAERAGSLGASAAALLTSAVVGLVVGEPERGRIRTALMGRAEISFAATIAEGRTLVRETRNLVAVLAEPRDTEGRLTAGWIRALVCRYPKLAIIGYCRAGQHSAQDILAFANAGAHDLVFHGVDDSGAGLRRVLETAGHASTAADIGLALAGLLPERAEAIMNCCLNYPQAVRTVQAVASALGCNRKTLSKYCASQGVPGPEALVSWSRLFLAAAALERTASSVESVALELDFGSSTGLRNLLRRHSGLRPPDLRRGGVAALRERFVVAIEQARRLHARPPRSST